MDFHLRYEILRCGPCNVRCGEWFPAVQGTVIPVEPRCAAHGGPLPLPLFRNPPLDRRGQPLPQWLLLRRFIKQEKRLPKDERVFQTVTLAPANDGTWNV